MFSTSKRRKLPQSRERFEQDGFVWFRQALTEPDLAKLERSLDFGERPGCRPKAHAELLSLLGPASPLGERVSTVLPNARPVRLVAFNKSSALNWAVPWHQDRVVALKEKAEVHGYSGWARRDGLWHAEPPVQVLEGMIFARIHLDRNDHANGAMQLASGSHCEGKVSADAADRIAQNYPTITCEAERGDIVLIKALTLHRSSASTSTGTRRALRVDFANQALPAPLEWGV